MRRSRDEAKHKLNIDALTLVWDGLLLETRYYQAQINTTSSKVLKRQCSYHVPFHCEIVLHKCASFIIIYVCNFIIF